MSAVSPPSPVQATMRQGLVTEAHTGAGSKVISTNKGKEKICFASHMYTKKHEGKTLITWRCAKRSSTNCRGTLKTDLDSGHPVEGAAHCHPPNDDLVAVTECNQEMKRKAQTSLDMPNQVDI